MKPRNLLAALLGLLPLPALAVVFAGVVRSDDAQPILTPASNSSPVVLRYFIADGTAVKPGDVVARIDAGQAASQVIELDAQIAQTSAKIAKEVAELKLKQVEAEQALADARAARDTAAVDAAIPKKLISALDYDRHRAEMQRSEHDLALKQQQLHDARAAVSRRQRDGKLELKKLQLERRYNQAQVETAEVRARRGGTVVHGFGNVFSGGGRFEEGSSSYPGEQIGEIVGTGTMSVRGWVLAPDRTGLATGQALCLSFDALPGRVSRGTIRAISGAPEAREEWGDGRYFVVDIDLPKTTPGLPLKPGMSVRANATQTQTCAVAAAPKRTDPKPVQASGEIYARENVAISPPQIQGLWQLTVTQMAGDGQQVKKGDPIVSFDGSEVFKKLTAKKSELEEKLRQQEKLRLELAVKARAERVDVAQAQADRTKAQRKASEPADYVPGVEYKKLLIDRRKTERRRELSVAHARAAAEERRAEQQQADADVARLKADVARLQSAIAELNVSAPRDGILLHASLWNGDKIDVGKQIWRGQSVATIPDLHTLAVRASLPERDLTRVHRGDPVRVTLSGGAGQMLAGHINAVGREVHSKSRIEPVPVVDLDIALDDTHAQIKPGQPVSVEISNAVANGAQR